MVFSYPGTPQNGCQEGFLHSGSSGIAACPARLPARPLGGGAAGMRIGGMSWDRCRRGSSPRSTSCASCALAFLIIKNAIKHRIRSCHMQAIELPEAGEMQCFLIAATSWKRIIFKCQASLFDKPLAFLR